MVKGFWRCSYHLVRLCKECTLKLHYKKSRKRKRETEGDQAVQPEEKFKSEGVDEQQHQQGKTDNTSEWTKTAKEGPDSDQDIDDFLIEMGLLG